MNPKNTSIAFAAFLLLMPIAFAIPFWVECTDNPNVLSDDGYYQYTFPFPWEYYGETITGPVSVSGNGTIDVSGTGFQYYKPTMEAFMQKRLIAPLWTDLRAASGNNPTYRCEFPDHVIFRWDTAEYSYPQNLQDFEVFVYDTGEIYFVYGNVTDNSGHNILAGVSRGNNEDYQVLKPLGLSAPTQDFGPISTIMTCPDGTCDLGENCPADAGACPHDLCYASTCLNGCGQTLITSAPDPSQCDESNMAGQCTELPCECDFQGNCVHEEEPDQPNDPLWNIYAITCLDSACENPYIIFVPGETVFLKVFDYEGAELSGTVRAPDYSETALSFGANDYAQIPFSDLGGYRVRIEAEKDGYGSFTDYYWFEVVPERPDSFSGPHFEVCLDQECLEPETSVETGDSVFYIVGFGTEGGEISATLNKSDGLTSPLTFTGNLTQLSPASMTLGEYTAEITLSKPGYADVETELWFEVVDERKQAFEAIHFETCFDIACGQPETLFEQGETAFIVGFDTENASLSGTVFFEDGSSSTLFFSGNTAQFPLASPGSFTARITASKLGYYDYTESLEFYAVQDRENPSAPLQEFEGIYFITTASASGTEGSILFSDEQSPVYIRAFDTEGAILTGTISRNGGSETALTFSGNTTTVPVQAGSYYAVVTASKEGYIPRDFDIEFKVVDEIAPIEVFDPECDEDGICDVGENHFNCWSDCRHSYSLPACNAADVDGDSSVTKADLWLVQRLDGATGFCGYEDVDEDLDVDAVDAQLVSASLGLSTEPCTRRVLTCGIFGGLVGYYRFEDDYLGINPLVADSSGLGNHGSMSGWVNFGRDGIVGRSATLDSEYEEGYISLPSGTELTPEQATISFWFRSDKEHFYSTVYQTGNRGSYTFDVEIDEEGFGVYFDLPGDHCVTYNDVEGNPVEVCWCSKIFGSTGGFDYLNWNHLAVTLDEGYTALYMNGRPIPGTYFWNEGNCYFDETQDFWGSVLGGVNLANTSFGHFEGSMDEVMLFDRSLSASEIQSLYDGSYWEEEAEPVSSCSVLDQPNTTYALESDIVGQGLTGPCFTVSAPGVVLDCQGHSIESDDAVAGVYSNQDYTMVRNCNIDMGDSDDDGKGIFLEGATNALIFNNTLHGQYYGMYLLSSDSSTVASNTIEANRRWEAYIKSSSGIQFSDNKITGGEEGSLTLRNSSNCEITNNTITESDESAIGLYQSSQNLISGNTLHSNAGGINLHDSSNNNDIYYNDLVSNSTGIGLSQSSQNRLTGNTLFENKTGIKLWFSSNHNIVEQNTVLASESKGISIWRDCAMNIISGNSILRGLEHGFWVSQAGINTLLDNKSCLNGSFDFFCENSTGLNGSGNFFTKVVPCSNGFPAFGANYEECPYISSCTDLATAGKTYLLDEDLAVDESDLNPYKPWCIEISANDITLDCQGHSITGAFDITAIFSGGSNTTVKNCTISMAQGLDHAEDSVGIMFDDVVGGKILNNVLAGEVGYPTPDSKGQWNGIWVRGSENVSVVGNVASRNVMHGILFDKCDNCVLESNVANANGYSGIYVSQCLQDGSPAFGAVLTSNITEYNYFDGINLLGARDGLVNDNFSCENALVETQYDDFRCVSGSTGNSGSGNTFGSVTACDDGWPEYADPNGTCEVFDPADVTRDGVVDLDDAYALDAEWNKEGCSVDNAWCRHADITMNGSVGMEDSDVLLAAMGNPPWIWFEVIEGLMLNFSGDFVVSSLVLDPPSVSPPGTVDVRVSVRNMGFDAGQALVEVKVFSLQGQEKASASAASVIGPGTNAMFSIPLSIDQGWTQGNYQVRVSVYSGEQLEDEAMKILSVGTAGPASILAIPELSLLLLPALLAAVLFIFYRRRRS